MSSCAPSPAAGVLEGEGCDVGGLFVRTLVCDVACDRTVVFGLACGATVVWLRGSRRRARARRVENAEKDAKSSPAKNSLGPGC